MFFSTRLLLLAITIPVITGAPFLGTIVGREEQLAEEYDYVIVGGGTAGLTVANRLSENPAINVLVLEAGIPDHKEGIAVLQRYLGGTMKTIYDWNITTVPQTFLGTANSVQNLTIGKVLGGSSVLNGMMFDRPSPQDINAWEELGNPGWNWQGLLPYYKKSETFTPPSPEHIVQFGITWDPAVHGTNGYIQSSYPNYIYPQNKNFQDAMISLGIKQSKDQAGSAIGAFWSPNSIDPVNQTRSSSRSGYYDKFAKRANLHALTSRHVTRLLTKKSEDSVTIVGVEYVEAGKETIKLVVKAKREYILSAGTVHDPQILQLSGIGPKKLLDKYNIKVTVDLPGVGNGFQDHPYCSLILKLSNVFPSPIDMETNATFDAEQKTLYYKNRTGTWTAGSPNSVAFLPLVNYTDASAAILSSYATQTTSDHLRVGLDSTIITGFAKQREVLLRHLATTKMASMEMIWLSGANRRYQMPFSFSIQHPFSRGFIEINSTNPFVQPLVDLRTASNPVDLDLFVQALKFGRKVVKTPAIQALEPTELQPGSDKVTDDELREYVRESIRTMFHPVGTSGMMPKRLGGVVDNRLRVYGVRNLRIVDASIIPLIPASHLQSTVYSIAEKAADLIKEDQY
ncbi:GMC oxidoreductase [Trichophaea hybrida]|nr:GMC oxidoreductase [Trichophaea hybrida]